MDNHPRYRVLSYGTQEPIDGYETCLALGVDRDVGAYRALGHLTVVEEMIYLPIHFLFRDLDDIRSLGVILVDRVRHDEVSLGLFVAILEDILNVTRDDGTVLLRINMRIE